ncbi:MAG: hypothetical protein AAF715_14450 [Myxococcota bacterium]
MTRALSTVLLVLVALAGCTGDDASSSPDASEPIAAGGSGGGNGTTGSGAAGGAPVPPPAGDGLLDCRTVAAPDYTGRRDAPDTWSEATREEVRAAGFDAWRTADANGRTCGDCHGVDGLDLAVFAYSDVDLRRRGAEHLDDEGVEAIVDFVHLWRTHYGLDAPCRIDAPVFQPGGAVLEGADAVAREVAFAAQLEALGYRVLADPWVATTDDAYAMYRQLLDADVRRIPIPMPLPHWSDDHARGEAYRDVNDWITDEGVVPREDERARWYALHDAYVDAPTEANLQAIVEAMPDVAVPIPLEDHPTTTRFLNRLNEERFLTALHAQHFFRAALEKRPSWLDYGPVAYDTRIDHRYKASGEHSQMGSFNSFSALVGVSHLADTACDRRDWPNEEVPASCFGHLPAGMTEELSAYASIWDEDAFGSYSPTWGVLGWLYDASMMTTRRHSNNMKYWRSDMINRDYYLLLMWMRATSLALKFGVAETERGPRWEVPDGLDPTVPVLDGRWWRHYLVAEWNKVTKGGDDGDRGVRNAAVLRLSQNMHVMVLRIMEDLLQSGASVNVPDELLAEFDPALDFVLAYPRDAAHQDDLVALGARVRAAVLAAPATDVLTVY